jgi:UDP-glucuronate decarboxylase
MWDYCRMRILLTGAAGFLGSHLTRKLLDNGHSVIGLDDLSTGSLGNLEFASSNPDFTFVEHDIREPFFTPVDGILNFACPASPKHYQSDPVRTIETNFLGIINMLHLAKQTGARLLQASTSEVYGDPIESPQRESYWGNVNPIGIRSCYDEGKRAAETLCFDYKRQYGLDTRVNRIFNTYGPNMSQDDGRVVSNFIVQALQNKPITIYGDGLQTRSFCYVSDLVDAIYLTFMYPNLLSYPINIGNPREFTMLQLAEEVISISNSKSVLKFEDLPEDDPKQRCPDISQARELLGWEPKVFLREGIEKTTQYFSNNLTR